jgi:hypothetical protein
MPNKHFKIIPLDGLKKAVNDLRRPIDFDKLMADGLLIKAGSWYEVPDINNLPNHAVQKISETRMEQDSDNPEINRTLVKFFKN